MLLFSMGYVNAFLVGCQGFFHNDRIGEIPSSGCGSIGSFCALFPYIAIITHDMIPKTYRMRAVAGFEKGLVATRRCLILT